MNNENKPKLLLLEDNEMIRRATAFALRRRFDVISVETASEARMEMRNCDALWTDWNLQATTSVIAIREAERLGKPYLVISAAPAEEIEAPLENIRKKPVKVVEIADELERRIK